MIRNFSLLNGLQYISRLLVLAMLLRHKGLQFKQLKYTWYLPQVFSFWLSFPTLPNFSCRKTVDLVGLLMFDSSFEALAPLPGESDVALLWDWVRATVSEAHTLITVSPYFTLLSCLLCKGCIGLWSLFKCFWLCAPSGNLSGIPLSFNIWNKYTYRILTGFL